jgi:hypothetical protein
MDSTGHDVLTSQGYATSTHGDTVARVVRQGPPSSVSQTVTVRSPR